ncbi:MAG TPA: response regulator transcription factor [Rubrivivax sp.]|jgi:DNA-binding NarL/FixJ family response regulator|nr:response regulator transcription factor [Rubrivivax sp.]
MELSAERTISVLAVDDHALLREGIAAVVESEPGLRYLGGAGTAAQGLAMFRSLRPDVTLLDVQLPDMSGIDLLATIRQDAPDARVIVLTTYRGDALASRALKGGALGYLLKSMLQSDMVAAIRAVHLGRKYVPADIAVELSARLGEQELSSRELEVLRMVATGSSNRQIGADLGISEQTVKGHLKNILGKLSANDRTHAVTIAVQRGIIVV